MTPERRLFARRASISISIIALAIGIGYYIVLHQWDLFLQICMGLFVIGLAIYVALDPGVVRKALIGRQGRYGSNALLLIIAFVGILAVINYLVYKNTKRWDLTADQSNTLSKETSNIVKSLPDTVIAKAFYTTDATMASSKENTKSLLDQYVYEGDGKFQYEFIDPNKDPVSAQEAGITRDGSIVLYMGTGKQPLTSISEQELTGAMVRLMNPGNHVVYFLTGHGEDPISGGSDQSYSQLKSALESKNYTVSTLNLLTTPQIPADASVLVIAGPDKPIDDSEVSLIDAYLKNGGSLVVMEEPPVVTQFGGAVDPLANYLSQNIGIILGNNMVVDVQAAQSLQQPFIAIANPYTQHAITQNMNGMASFYPTARSVTTDENSATDYSKTVLISTADQSWAETDMASVQDGSMAPDQAVDLFGPVPLAVAAEGKNNDSRVVVFGDSDFALNANYGVYGNGDMIVNSIDWAAKEDNLINLTPKATVDRYLIQPTPYMLGMILLGSLVILPGVVIVAGIATWLMRRRQG
jgi:gliding motility-associatede transport system auxiliary component